MAAAKKILGFLLKFLVVLAALLVLSGAGLFIYYLVTLEDPLEYVPDDFALYLKVDSIREIYDNVLDLKAADVVFSTPELRFIYNAILEFKSNEFFKTELFKQLLGRSAHFLISKDFSPVIIFDPGIVSLGTRALPLLNFFYNFDDLKIKTINKGSLNIYNYNPAPGQSFYFTFNNNLIFLSTTQRNIEKLYEIKKSQKNVKNNEALSSLSKKILQKGFMDLYISTNDLINSTLGSIPELRNLLRHISLNSYSILSFFVSNEELRLNAYTEVEKADAALNELLNYNPGALNVIRYLPQNTNIFSAINFRTFKQMYEAALNVKGEEIKSTYKTVDDSCKFLLKASLEELFFSWTGSEAGAITVGKSLDPIIYLKINDRSKFEFAFKKIADSLVLDTDTSLVLDEVRVNRIAFPPFIKMIVDAFVKGIETPYYIVIDDYVFFCMNAENLANLQNDYRSTRHLIKETKFKNVAQNVSQATNIFMYYNFGSSMPKFLGYDTLLTRLLGLYEKGAFSINFSNTEIRINIAAFGIAGNKTSPFPGFPKKLETAPASDIICKNIKGSGTVELIYVDEKANLVIEELFADTKNTAPVENTSVPLVMKNRDTQANEIFVFSPSGTLYKFSEEAAPLDPFPMITTCKNSFAPLEIDGKLLLYSQSEKALILFSSRGSQQKLPLDLKNDVLSVPSYLDGFLAFYPKSFENSVWLADIEGNVKNGWPQEVDGISFCSPLLFKDSSNRILIAFLTQGGQLNLWNTTGQSSKGMPLDLEGVYYASPEPLSHERNADPFLLTLSEDGLLSLVNLRGEIVKSKKLEEGGDRNYKIALFDFDRDGADEIFIYGARNTIIGLDAKLNYLPGFPIKGSQRPNFSDLNYDGKYELIVGSFDGNLYVYTLDK
jgi:hypothetical protein